MKNSLKILFAGSLMVSCLFLTSCGPEENKVLNSDKDFLQQQTQEIAAQIGKGEWKPVIEKMTEDFSFQYGKTYKGDKKAVGGKPYRDSIKVKNFILYTHDVTDINKITDVKYTVNANATMEISYNNTGRKKADWPVVFTWVKQGKDWKLADVHYLAKREFSITKQPDKTSNSKTDKTPVRAYSTQEAATSIGTKDLNYGSGNEAQQKAKKSIKTKIDELNQKNR